MLACQDVELAECNGVMGWCGRQVDRQSELVRQQQRRWNSATADAAARVPVHAVGSASVRERCAWPCGVVCVVRVSRGGGGAGVDVGGQRHMRVRGASRCRHPPQEPQLHVHGQLRGLLRGAHGARLGHRAVAGAGDQRHALAQLLRAGYHVAGVPCHQLLLLADGDRRLVQPVRKLERLRRGGVVALHRRPLRLPCFRHRYARVAALYSQFPLLTHIRLLFSNWELKLTCGQACPRRAIRSLRASARGPWWAS
jgi:hypothetical protein